MILHYILFIILIVLLTIIFPLSGMKQKRVINEYRREGRALSIDRKRQYWNTILVSWLAPVAILLTFIATGVPFSELGFRLPSHTHFKASYALYQLAHTFVALYIGALITAFILFRLFPRLKANYIAKIPSLFKPLLPRDRSERGVWWILSITAGVTEELIFRGYLFFIIPFIFHATSLWPSAIASICLFAIGHLYQGREAFKPFVAGILFTFIYYATGSLLCIVILHTLQDAFASLLLKSSAMEPKKISEEQN